jgi:hypothetical protein
MPVTHTSDQSEDRLAAPLSTFANLDTVHGLKLDSENGRGLDVLHACTAAPLRYCTLQRRGSSFRHQLSLFLASFSMLARGGPMQGPGNLEHFAGRHACAYAIHQ